MAFLNKEPRSDWAYKVRTDIENRDLDSSSSSKLRSMNEENKMDNSTEKNIYKAQFPVT